MSLIVRWPCAAYGTHLDSHGKHAKKEKEQFFFFLDHENEAVAEK